MKQEELVIKNKNLIFEGYFIRFVLMLITVNFCKIKLILKMASKKFTEAAQNLSKAADNCN